MSNPYLFIVGCPRSGTTLLQRIVDAHSDITITHETHWIAKWYEKRKGVTAEGTVTPELISRLAAYHRFERWPMSREDLDQLISGDEPVSYADFVTSFFDLYRKQSGKRLVGDKTPEYVRYVSTLHKLWPRARFVHIIRDGRDVCLSATNWKKSSNLAGRFPTWLEHPTVTAALWWEWLTRLGREDGQPLGPELYREVRYESLVAYPEEECRSLCGFLDLPHDAGMLRFHEGRENNAPGLDAKKAWRPVTAGLRKWQSQMSPGDIELFEAAAGDLLDELGYERAAPNPSPEALENASEVRESFVQTMRSRGNRLPEVWR